MLGSHLGLYLESRTHSRPARDLLGTRPDMNKTYSNLLGFDRYPPGTLARDLPKTHRACLEVDSVGFGLSFGLQTQTSVRHMLVSTEDLRFWRPGGKVLVLGPAHWLGLRVTVVCMCEGSAITISLLWLCYFFLKKNGIQF
jgi:hypothetical protein